MAVAFGVAFGIVVGSVAFATTQNPIWVGIGIPFGAALGIAYGEVIQETGTSSPCDRSSGGRAALARECRRNM